MIIIYAISITLIIISITFPSIELRKEKEILNDSIRIVDTFKDSLLIEMSEKIDIKTVIRVLENLNTYSTNKRCDSINIYFFSDTLNKEDFINNLIKLDKMK